MPYRHAAITANMAATLDIISDGRFELGLGAGWNQEEADAYGISLGTTISERMDMFDEAVEAVEAVEAIVGLLTNARCEPKGPQRPLPIVIGGGGERRTLRTAARWADHWNAGPLEPDVWLHKRAVLDQHCADVDRDPSEIVNSMVFLFDPNDVGELAGRLAIFSEAGLDIAMVTMPTPHDPDHVDLIGNLAESMA